MVNRRAGRPAAGGRDNRGAILEAARTLFAERGYDSTTMRAVASAAEVDVALIYHHYGNKEGLLRATLAVLEEARPSLGYVAAGTPEPGRAVARLVLQMWEEQPSIREQSQTMIRTALSHPSAVQMWRDVHVRFVLGVVDEVVADDDRELRASLIGAYFSGLLVDRYMYAVPVLADTDLERLIDAAGPVIDHYLTGTLTGSS